MGDDHPWTATGIKNLGELLLKMGDSAGAQAQFSEALRIRKLVCGDTHPLVAEARTLLGSARALQKVSVARCPTARMACAEGPRRAGVRGERWLLAQSRDTPPGEQQQDRRPP